MRCTCGRDFENARGLRCHERRCDGQGTKSDKRKNSQKSEWICPKCGFNIKSSRKKHVDACDGTGPRSAIKRQTQSDAARQRWQRVEYRQKVVEGMLAARPTGLGSTESIENNRREKIRQKINERYADGWQPRCGRCPKYQHSSPIAGVVKVDGLWELAVCRFLDQLTVKWSRNTRRFAYTKPDGARGTYCPDFFVEDWREYIEVKGYETALDRCKWSDFPKDQTLRVWRKDDLIAMGILEDS